MREIKGESTHESQKAPSRVSIWAILSSFLILWVTITAVAFSSGVNSAAFVISAVALVPLVICGALIVLQDHRRR